MTPTLRLIIMDPTSEGDDQGVWDPSRVQLHNNHAVKSVRSVGDHCCIPVCEIVMCLVVVVIKWRWCACVWMGGRRHLISCMCVCGGSSFNPFLTNNSIHYCHPPQAHMSCYSKEYNTIIENNMHLANTVTCTFCLCVILILRHC